VIGLLQPYFGIHESELLGCIDARGIAMKYLLILLSVVSLSGYAMDKNNDFADEDDNLNSSTPFGRVLEQVNESRRTEPPTPSSSPQLSKSPKSPKPMPPVTIPPLFISPQSPRKLSPRSRLEAVKLDEKAVEDPDKNCFITSIHKVEKQLDRVKSQVTLVEEKLSPRVERNSSDVELLKKQVGDMQIILEYLQQESTKMPGKADTDAVDKKADADAVDKIDKKVIKMSGDIKAAVVNSQYAVTGMRKLIPVVKKNFPGQMENEEAEALKRAPETPLLTDIEKGLEVAENKSFSELIAALKKKNKEYESRLTTLEGESDQSAQLHTNTLKTLRLTMSIIEKLIANNVGGITEDEKSEVSAKIKQLNSAELAGDTSKQPAQDDSVV